MRILLLFLLVLVMLTALTDGVPDSGPCPPGCSCDQPWGVGADEWWAVNCEDISEFPESLPDRTRKLMIHMTGWAHIPSGSLKDRQGLQELQIGGHIREIHDNAFNSLDPTPFTSGSKLIISSANVTTVQTDAFNEVTKYDDVILENSYFHNIFHKGLSGFKYVKQLTIRVVEIRHLYGKAISGMDGNGLSTIHFHDSTIHGAWGYPISDLRVPNIFLNSLSFSSENTYDRLLADLQDVDCLEIINVQFPMDWGKGLLANISGISTAVSTLKIENFEGNMLAPMSITSVRDFHVVEFINCRFNNVKGNAFHQIRDIKTLTFDCVQMLEVEPEAFLNLRYVENFELLNCSINAIYNNGFKDFKDIGHFVIDGMAIYKLYAYAFKTFHDVNAIIFRNFNVTEMEGYAFKDFMRVQTVTFQDFYTPNLQQKAIAYWSDITNINFIRSNIRVVSYDSICEINKVGTFTFEDCSLGTMESEVFQMVGCIHVFQMNRGTITKAQSQAFKGIQRVGVFKFDGVTVSDPNPEMFNEMRNILNFEVNLDDNNFPVGFSIDVTPVNDWTTSPQSICEVDHCYPPDSGDQCSIPITITTASTTTFTKASTKASASSSSTLTTANPSGTSGQNPSTDGGFPLLYIILAAVGGAVLVILIVLVVLCCWCCRRKRSPPAPTEPYSEPTASRPSQSVPAIDSPTYLGIVPDSTRGNTYDYIDDRAVRVLPTEGNVNKGYEKLDGYLQPQHQYQGLSRPPMDPKKK